MSLHLKQRTPISGTVYLSQTGDGQGELQHYIECISYLQPEKKQLMYILESTGSLSTLTCFRSFLNCFSP